MSAFDFRAVAQSVQLPDERFQIALAASTGLLIFSEAVGFYLGSVLFKLTSSLVFVAAGIHGATESGPISQLLESENRSSLCILGGLVLSALGDILLVPSKEAYRQPLGSAARVAQSKSSIFKFGGLSFALAQIAYIASFLISIDFSNVSIALKATGSDFRAPDFVMTLVFGYLLIDWLGILEKERKFSSWFEVPPETRGLVGGYIVVIMTMVATATATDKGLQRITGAWLLMISNLFLAASAFGVEDDESAKEAAKKKQKRVEWKNSAMGWIIYYGAQLVFAGCV